jgi:tetratricopeptide (TPR) repeat protein
LALVLGFVAVLAVAPPISAQNAPEGEEEEQAAPLDAFDENADARALRLEEEARTLFEAGRMAFADGRFGDALHSFQRSFALSDRPVLLFNIGTSFDRLQQKAEAIEAFESYLERIPDAHNRGEVESRIASLRESVAADEARAEELRQEEEHRRALEAELAARDAEGTPLYAKWWFWTIIGALIVGGAITAGILLYDPGQEAPTVGSTGQVTVTLGGP